MALDRQKILNELSSVMNQLKSTDCGCMGKLFGDSGLNTIQTATCGGYRQGYCHNHHYGCNSTPNNIQNTHRSCMGQCNPPKLYADTYNYLNKNLMQPTINEVYNDLKDITPANTIMNYPISKQMGFANGNQLTQPAKDCVAPFQTEKQNITSTFNTTNHPDTNNTNSINMDQISGMGPQIVSMFGDHTPKLSNIAQQAKPVSNQLNYSDNIACIAKPQYTNQLLHQTNQQSKGNFQHTSNMNANVGLNQQTTPNNRHYHGEHTQGIAKFNEMFPGVMKNGDLGFDPMAIAIQMNPANQKQVAVDTIHKMMNKNNGTTTSLKTNENIAGFHTGLNVSADNNQYSTHPKDIQGNIVPNEILQSNDDVKNQQTNPQMVLQQQTIATSGQLNNQQNMPYQQVYQSSSNSHGLYPKLTNQNTYTTLTSTPLVNQQQQPLYHQRPITGADTDSAIPQPNLPTIYEGSSILNNHQRGPDISNTQQIIKEPIFPADTSKLAKPNQKYYNTLGQPIQMLPAKMFHTPEPGLPQTLSPQFTTKPRNDFIKYSNVKSTISKTSLMGNKPVGKTPSRNQLQQIYNQYKGSQSYTNQNIKEQPDKNVSHSEGKLNVPRVNLHAHLGPIENVGGDTAANNGFNDERVNKMEHVIGQIGDAPNVKQTNNVPETLSPAANRKYRNGLQDIVYTSYPTSAAWSFHGHGRAVPSSAGYRYRNKI